MELEEGKEGEIGKPHCQGEYRQQFWFLWENVNFATDSCMSGRVSERESRKMQERQCNPKKLNRKNEAIGLSMARQSPSASAEATTTI